MAVLPDKWRHHHELASLHHCGIHVILSTLTIALVVLKGTATLDKISVCRLGAGRSHEE